MPRPFEQRIDHTKIVDIAMLKTLRTLIVSVLSDVSPDTAGRAQHVNPPDRRINCGVACA